MENHDLILGQNHDLAGGQNQQIVLGNPHNMGISQNHGLELVHSHEHEVGLGRNHEHEMGLGERQDHNRDAGHEYDENGLPMEQKHEHEGQELANESNELVLFEHNELGVEETKNLMRIWNYLWSMTCGRWALNIHMTLVSLTVRLYSLPLLQSSGSSSFSEPDYELRVGQEFPDAKSCRRALRDTAIALHFEIQTIKSDKTRFTAKCASEGCPWHIHAAKLPGVPTFIIRTINDNHTCGGIAHLGHQQASVQWVATSVDI